MRMTEVPMLNTAVQHPPSLDEDFLAAALCRLYHVPVRRETLLSWMSLRTNSIRDSWGCS